MVTFTKIAVKCLFRSLFVLWLVLTLVHLALLMAKGNPVSLLVDPRLSPVQREALEEKFGYHASPLEQYRRYLVAITKGNFGVSFIYKAPVAKVLLPRMGKSALLGSLALFLAMVLSAGMLYGMHRATSVWLRRASEAVMSLVIAVPAFVWAPIFLAWLARGWGWFPSYGSRSLFLDATSTFGTVFNMLWHAFLPALCLALPLAGQLTAYLHEQVRTTSEAPFVLSALGRGVPKSRVFWNHQMRRVLPSIIQWLGLYVPILAGGAVVIEAIFGWPGVGLVLFDAVLGRDYPLLLGGCIWVTALVVPGYQLADWYRQNHLEPGV